jgi:hypothetical protein
MKDDCHPRLPTFCHPVYRNKLGGILHPPQYLITT